MLQCLQRRQQEVIVVNPDEQAKYSTRTTLLVSHMIYFFWTKQVGGLLLGRVHLVVGGAGGEVNLGEREGVLHWCGFFSGFYRVSL